MVFTFHTPWGMNETCEAIGATVASMNGKIKEVSPGCFTAKWRIHPEHKTEFNYKCKFYVGEDMITAVIKDANEPKNIKKFSRLSRMMKFWNTFIEHILKQYPDVEFGLMPGVPMVSAVKIYGDGTEQVFTSTTRNSPNIGGALVGGWLFGTAGAIIGASSGSSHTEGSSRIEFSYSIPAKVRYTNGLLLEGHIRKNSPLYHEIMGNLSRLSEN